MPCTSVWRTGDAAQALSCAARTCTPLCPLASAEGTEVTASFSLELIRVPMQPGRVVTEPTPHEFRYDAYTATDLMAELRHCNTGMVCHMRRNTRTCGGGPVDRH